MFWLGNCFSIIGYLSFNNLNPVFQNSSISNFYNTYFNRKFIFSNLSTFSKEVFFYFLSFQSQLFVRLCHCPVQSGFCTFFIFRFDIKSSKILRIVSTNFKLLLYLVELKKSKSKCLIQDWETIHWNSLCRTKI